MADPSIAVVKDRVMWHVIAFILLWNATGWELFFLFWGHWIREGVLVTIFAIGSVVLARMVASMGTSA